MEKSCDETELVREAHALTGRTAPEAWSEVLELIESARSLGVPTNVRRDDAPVFIGGTEPIATATWTQCGGILFAVAQREAPDAIAVVVQVLERIAELAPAHSPQVLRQ